MKTAALAVGLAVILSTAAFADPWVAPNERHAVPVTYEDLDLSRADDAAALVERLHSATQRACALRELAHQGPAARRAVRACRDDALQVAIERINEPEVTRVYQSARR
ncbi:MAG: UrcA family protein [Alphaproteobacteria bacterium]|nr:UrcA family protein [Alphaproteobacteria bacterium]